MSNEATDADLRTAAEHRYLSYALSVITSRALPDVRDGLKPVQRRILFAMFRNLRLLSGAKPRKSAQIVGEVIGKYHPHGDTAAYDAMVRMAQDFSLRYPLVNGQGNFGSLDGDSPAAYRYTEAKLTRIAEELLEDLGADTVDWRPNYDATNDEPSVLPSRLPQLLINGSTGIAVGMATNIPPHNLNEVCDALIALIDDPKLEVKDLLKHIKGPDFPTAGELLTSRGELLSIYETGHGPLKLRGAWKMEKAPRGKQHIIVHEIPYAVNKATLIEQIANLIIDRKLPLLVDVRDESTAEVRIVLELKTGADPEAAMAYLFKHSDLQVNFHVNLTCLSPVADSPAGQPSRVSLLELCRSFLDFRLEVVTRRLAFEQRKLQERLHILAGFIAIYGDIDLAIRIIRKAESRANANKKLCKAFELDEVQADAILEIRLYQLAKLEIDKIREEFAAKSKRLKEVEKLLKSPKARWGMIRNEMLQLREDHGDKRRTATSVRGKEDLAYDPDAYIVHEEATVLITKDGWIRRVRELKEGAKPRLREGDSLWATHIGSTKDRIAFFSTQGVLYVTAVADLPATTGYGEPVQSLFRFKDREKILYSMLVQEDAPELPAPSVKEKKTQAELFAKNDVIELEQETRPILVASERGYGFRAAPELSPTTRTGRRFARVATDDQLVVVSEIAGDEVVCLASGGKGLRFPLGDVAELAGVGRGVILMRVDPSESLLGAVTADINEKLIIEIEGGNPRQTPVKEFPPINRGGKGNKVVKRGKPAGLRARD
ncbi:MAG: DNA topoisomerase IV subunit A [Deltaproteobacteria bacterium]